MLLEKGYASTETIRIIKRTLADPIINKLLPQTQFLDPQATIDHLDCQGYFRNRNTNTNETNENENENETQTNVRNDGGLPNDLKTFTHDKTLMSSLGAMVMYLSKLLLDEQILSNAHFTEYNPLKSGTNMLLDGQTLLNLEILQNVSTLGSEGMYVCMYV